MAKKLDFDVLGLTSISAEAKKKLAELEKDISDNRKKIGANLHARFRLEKEQFVTDEEKKEKAALEKKKLSDEEVNLLNAKIKVAEEALKAEEEEHKKRRSLARKISGKDMTEKLASSLKLTESIEKKMMESFTQSFMKKDTFSKAFMSASDKDREALTKGAVSKMGFSKGEGLIAEKILEKMMKDKVFDDLAKKTGNIFYPITKRIEDVFKDFRKWLGKEFPVMFGEHFDELVEGMGDWFKSTLSPIFEPIDKLIAPFQMIGKYLLGVGKALFGSREEKEQKKQTGLLNSIRNALTRGKGKDTAQEARDLMAGENEKRRWMEILKKVLFTLLGAAAFAAGAIGGMVMKTFLNPFLALAKIPGFGWIGKLIGKITGWFSGLLAIVESLSTSGKWFSKFFGILGKFVGGFIKGFGPIGWVISAVIAIFDFMKGFKNTKGNILQKVIGGIKEAFLGFFMLPIKLIGWLADKALGFIGIEVKGGVGNKINEFIRRFFDNIYGYFKEILSIPINRLKGIWEAITMIFQEGRIMDGLKKLFDEMNPIKLMFDIFKAGIDFMGKLFNVQDLMKKIIDYIKQMFPTLGKFLPDVSPSSEIPPAQQSIQQSQQAADNVGKVAPSTANIGSDVDRAKADAANRQLQEAEKTNESVNKTNENLNKMAVTNQQTNNTISTAVNNMQRVEDKDDIPTDIDNLGILFMNKTFGWG